MAYRAKISIYDLDGGLINAGDWSQPIAGRLLDVINRVRAHRKCEFKETDTGWVMVDQKRLRVAADPNAEVHQVTEFEPVEEATPRPRDLDEAETVSVAPLRGFLSDEVQARRARYYELADMLFALDDDDIRYRRHRVSVSRSALAQRQTHAKPGREDDGQRLTHYVATLSEPDNPRSLLVWAQLDTGHPIAEMFRKGSLGTDEAQAYGRYRAAEVWYRFYTKVSGRSGYNAVMGEMVDGSADPEAGAVSVLNAAHERLAVLDAKGMTKIRFDDLDSVVGAGNRIADRALATGRDQKTVRKSLLRGLDAVSGFGRWDKEIQRVQVVAAYDQKRRA